MSSRERDARGYLVESHGTGCLISQQRQLQSSGSSDSIPKIKQPKPNVIVAIQNAISRPRGQSINTQLMTVLHTFQIWFFKPLDIKDDNSLKNQQKEFLVLAWS